MAVHVSSVSSSTRDTKRAWRSLGRYLARRCLLLLHLRLATAATAGEAEDDARIDAEEVGAHQRDDDRCRCRSCDRRTASRRRHRSSRGHPRRSRSVARHPIACRLVRSWWMACVDCLERPSTVRSGQPAFSCARISPVGMRGAVHVDVQVAGPIGGHLRLVDSLAPAGRGEHVLPLCDERHDHRSVDADGALMDVSHRGRHAGHRDRTGDAAVGRDRDRCRCRTRTVVTAGTSLAPVSVTLSLLPIIDDIDEQAASASRPTANVRCHRRCCGWNGSCGVS